ncbi:MAG: aminotransferase class I/II-fold pyridoxal phosphate-dependent enzyme [Aigarchaeota archaeon]|nr:aminotransferase class I/II-fold pyridoxal phosphate-dependent enzyme [Candidatus Pelearchaeum maunauluense]
MSKYLASRVGYFPESVIRLMSQLAAKYRAVNLAQGSPDFNPPREVLDAAKQALDAGYNQYAIAWGSPRLRQALAERVRKYNNIEIDPETEVVVTCGTTEGMVASILSLVEPGEEVVVFEPFYENYVPDTLLAGGVPRFVELKPPSFAVDEEELKNAFTNKTKLVILNNPNNPSGKVFTCEELKLIRDLCIDYDVIAIVDEVYEYIIYDGLKHISLASLDGMFERTLTISGISKTYNATGWRVGWVIGEQGLLEGVKKIHEFLTVGAPNPLQEAAATALSLPDEYYRWLVEQYNKRRMVMLRVLGENGFKYYKPQAAYFVLADITEFGFEDDSSFAEFLVREVGVAVVPGSSFYHDGWRKDIVRFQFARHLDILEEAGRRLARLSSLKGRENQRCGELAECRKS